MSTTDPSALIAEVALKHGVALDLDDPILMLHTATAKILDDALQAAQSAQDAALDHQRAHFEQMAAQSKTELSAASRRFTEQFSLSTRRAVEQASADAASAARSALARTCYRHERAMTRLTAVCAGSCVICVLVGGAVLWSC